jgi:hypothetical protein
MPADCWRTPPSLIVRRYDPDKGEWVWEVHKEGSN